MLYNLVLVYNVLYSDTFYSVHCTLYTLYSVLQCIMYIVECTWKYLSVLFENKYSSNG